LAAAAAVGSLIGDCQRPAAWLMAMQFAGFCAPSSSPYCVDRHSACPYGENCAFCSATKNPEPPPTAAAAANRTAN